MQWKLPDAKQTFSDGESQQHMQADNVAAACQTPRALMVQEQYRLLNVPRFDRDTLQLDN